MSRPTSPLPDDVTSWPADRLIDHLVSTHHAYERAALARIDNAFATLVRVVGPGPGCVTDGAAAFDRLKESLKRHLDKEEYVLFPHIRELAAEQGYEPRRSPFGTVANPIRMMEREHREALTSLQAIRRLVAECARLNIGTANLDCAEELSRLDEDLQRHVNIEDHVLFPKAIELEARANCA
jgi:regulator of cell morphogenesis and NO signaling